MRAIDRLGQRYGRLTVIKQAESPDGNARWVCRCDCGQLVVAYGGDLQRSKVKSCGCLNAERIFRHGMSRTKVYAVWKSMLQRCENPNDPSYHNYGARGITVCEEWHDFARFFADMKLPPPRRTLERKDNSKGYSKRNCVWATTRQQLNNQRRNRVVEYKGARFTLAELAELHKLGWNTLRSRLDVYGWELERALTEPVHAADAFKYRGKTRTLRQWAAECDIPLETLRSRVRKLGWSIDRALTEPVTPKRPSS